MRHRCDPWVGKIPWQPASVFLPEKFHEQKSLASYSAWGLKESDMPERVNTHEQT